MKTGPAYRTFDRTLTATPVDAGGFPDDWINTSDSPQGWHSLQTSVSKDSPVLHARLPDGGIIEFPTITFYGGTGGPDLTAFSAEIAGEEFRILLQGNLNLGLLVLATFKIPLGGGVGYFSREFFARSSLQTPITAAANGEPEALFSQFAPPEFIDPAPLLGRWRNADFQTQGLLELTIEKKGSELIATALGTSTNDDSPIEWGNTDVEIHACLDEAGQASLAALASWHFDTLETHLQLRVPGGTLAIAGFNEFRDGRMNYSTREFFYRAPR